MMKLTRLCMQFHAYILETLILTLNKDFPECQMFYIVKLQEVIFLSDSG